MKLFRRSLVAMTVGGLVGACLPESDLLGPNPEIGEGLVYNLILFNSRNLPFVVTEGPPRLELQRGALTLSTDSTWIVSQVYRVTDAGQNLTQTITRRGNYTRAGAALRLQMFGDTTTQYVGTWSAEAVVLNDRAAAQGDQLDFRK
ncbi:MAG: hypothetical protein ACT4OZ_12160 [Gemmatimonadota bacterium]